MKVKELITFLETQDEELTVAYRLYSEALVMELDEISVKSLCKPRSDGWIQNNRLDKETQEYLVFPGN